MIKLNAVYEILDNILSQGVREVVIAYSGGKDSTALSIMLYNWVNDRKIKDVKITFVNVDTLCEIPLVRDWAIEFMEAIVKRFLNSGVEATYSVLTPKPIDTFYWRVLVRGYPAPSFSFRWCVELLKRRPSRNIVNNHNSVILLGHRDDESPARSTALRNRLGLCPLSAGRCVSHYLQIEGEAKRIYPIRDFKEGEIWSFLERKKMEFNLDKLFTLYGYETFRGLVKARYGCWFCTLIKHQVGHYILGGKFMFLEAGRLIYRWLSDIPELRARKNSGYSRLGYLLQPARSIILYSLKAIEDLSGIKLYGLDEAKLLDYSLRKILYELDEEESNNVIRVVEGGNIDNKRICNVEDIRKPNNRSLIIKTIESLRTRANRLTTFLLENPAEYVNMVLDEVEKMIV